MYQKTVERFDILSFFMLSLPYTIIEKNFFLFFKINNNQIYTFYEKINFIGIIYYVNPVCVERAKYPCIGYCA